MDRKRKTAQPPAPHPRAADAAHLLQLWATDSESFDEILEDALASGDQPLVDALLAGANPNDRLAISDAVAIAAETLEIGDGSVARLFAVPVLVDARDGGAPDAQELCKAVGSSGLLPGRGKTAAAGHYFPLDGMATLGACARRAMLEAVAKPREPGRDGRLPISQRAPEGREEMVLVMAAILPGEDDTVSFLDGDPLPANERAAREALLRCGGGIVDVGEPCAVASLATLSGEEAEWLTLSRGAPAEVAGFLAAAAEAAGQDRVDAVLRRVAGRTEVRLLSASGALLDTRQFDPAELPMAEAEFEREVARLARSVTRAADWDGIADFLRGAPPAPPERRAPTLGCVEGGRLARERQDREAWHAGLRQRMAELRASPPKRAD